MSMTDVDNVRNFTKRCMSHRTCRRGQIMEGSQQLSWQKHANNSNAAFDWFCCDCCWRWSSWRRRVSTPTGADWRWGAVTDRCDMFSSLEFLVVLVRKTSWRRRWRSSVANQSLRWRRVSPSSVSHCHLLMLPAWQAPPHLHQLLEASVSFAGLKQRNLGVAKEASVQMPKQMSQIVITIWSNGIWHEMVWVWEPLTASKSKGHACHLSPIPMAQQQHALVPWAKAQPAAPMPQPPTVQSRELWHRVLLSVKRCLQSPIEAELRDWSLCCALTAFWCLVDTIEL